MITFLRFQPLSGLGGLEIEVSWDRGQLGQCVFNPLLEVWRPRGIPPTIGELQAAIARQRVRRRARWHEANCRKVIRSV